MRIPSVFCFTDGCIEKNEYLHKNASDILHKTAQNSLLERMNLCKTYILKKYEIDP